MIKSSVAFVFSLIAVMASSQSHYSHFGVGQPVESGFAKSNASANAFLVNNDSLASNLLNPASLTNLKFTAFNLGMTSSFTNTKTTSSNGFASSTGFKNMSLAFPIIKGNWGLAFGVKPYTEINNEQSYTTTNSLVGSIATTNKNSGGLNSLYIANGFAYKNFSVGLTTSFIIGDNTNTVTSDFKEDNLLSSQLVTNNTYKGLNLEYGFQYLTNLDDESAIGIGIVMSSKTTFDVTSSISNTTYSETREFVIETLTDTSITFNAFVPQKLSAGLFYQLNEKLKIGASYSAQNWSEFSSNNNADSLKNSKSYSIGAEFQPDKSDYKNYFNRVIYSLGFKYSDGHINLLNTDITETGITIGVELPVRGGAAKLNLGAEFGQRGTTDNLLFQENYGRIYLGLTFNDEWFKKIQYD